jgi:hypothetical protein
MVFLIVHVAHTDNVLLGLFAAAKNVGAASSSARMPSSATAFITRAMYGAQASPYVLYHAARESPLVPFT